MWSVQLHWEQYTFSSSAHIYVYELLKWQCKLNGKTLQMLLNCSSGFMEKKLGKILVPQKSKSWLKKCVSRMHSILHVKWSQFTAFVSALLDAKGEIQHTLPHGHIDNFWVYPGANKHGYLLKQLHNNKVSICAESTPHTQPNLQPTSSMNTSTTITSPTPTTSCPIPPLPGISKKKQHGSNGNEAQVYISRSDPKAKFSNIDIVRILQNPDEQKISYAATIKPKGGKVFILYWQGSESKIKDYVADQYVWVADSTKKTVHLGVTLVKKYYNIWDGSAVSCSKKVANSRDFKKTISYIQDNPFLQVVEYIGDETV